MITCEIQTYRHELLEAYECCMKYKRTGKDAELTQVPTPFLLEEILIVLNFSILHYEDTDSLSLSLW